MKNRWSAFTLGMTLLLAASVPVPAQMPPQERGEEEPAKAPGTIPPQRDIFVPIWTEPVSGDKTSPAAVRRQRADFVWTSVPLSAARIEPDFRPPNGSATLLQFRRSTARVRAGERQQFVVVIRLATPRDGTQPFLEIVDGATWLQSRALGSRMRQTPEGVDWLFTLPDPLLPPSGVPNAVSARIDMDSSAGRAFQIRLVSQVAER